MGPRHVQTVPPQIQRLGARHARTPQWLSQNMLELRKALTPQGVMFVKHCFTNCNDYCVYVCTAARDIAGKKPCVKVASRKLLSYFN